MEPARCFGDTWPMSAQLSHTSLRRRLILPVVGLLIAAVIANVGFAAWLATRRSAIAAGKQQEQVAAALAASRVSLSLPVLDALHRLTGSHFLVWNGTAGGRGPSTIDASALDAAGDAAIAAGIAAGGLDIAGQRYRIGTTRSQGVRPETVLVLTPQRGLIASTLEAVWPVLAVAAATLAALLPLGLRTTAALAGRIAAVERHVGRIAAGDFGPQLTLDDSGDEVGRLVAGVNRMSAALGELRTTLVAGERQRLLGQLAAGFAHELRNAITGARLAIDLHRRRCPAPDAAADQSLAVATRQLAIVEEEVRGLLALGRPGEAARGPVAVDDLLASVRDLTAPRCEHAGVRLVCQTPAGITLVGRSDPLRAALVNLALNAIEAAGRGGLVRLTGATIDDRIELAVEDSGPGPPEAIRHSLAEPFVSGKPEGIGLGLAIVKAVAEEHGGGLSWSRLRESTRFTISLPAATLDPMHCSRTAEPSP
jgi:signal transduction histidine kinase